MVVYVDVDDTLVRTVGAKRIPMPGTVRNLQALKAGGAELYLWSRGGGAYARESAEELGIADLFAGFLPKPEALLDDQGAEFWSGVAIFHPNAGEELVTIADGS